jgi:hypothetical protein
MKSAQRIPVEVETADLRTDEMAGVVPPVVASVPLPRTDPSAPRAEIDSRLCSCGHMAEAHMHLRRGNDCGVCGAAVCARFRQAH